VQQTDAAKTGCPKTARSTRVVGGNASIDPIEVSPRLPAKDDFRHISAGAEQ
jgi:hypothetical protein